MCVPVCRYYVYIWFINTHLPMANSTMKEAHLTHTFSNNLLALRDTSQQYFRALQLRAMLKSEITNPKLINMKNSGTNYNTKRTLLSIWDLNKAVNVCVRWLKWFCCSYKSVNVSKWYTVVQVLTLALQVNLSHLTNLQQQQYATNENPPYFHYKPVLKTFSQAVRNNLYSFGKKHCPCFFSVGKTKSLLSR